jgi:cytochrome P450
MSATAPAPSRLRHLPVLGPSLAYVADPLALMRDQHDRHGPVSEMTFVGRKWTVLLGPDACGEALRNGDKAFSSGLGWGYLVGPFFQRGLMLLDFEEHHRHRHLLQEAFTRQRLIGYVDQLGPAVERHLDAWQPGPDVQVHWAVKSLALDLATEIFMGGAELDRVNRAFIDCVQAANGYVRAPLPRTRWGRAAAGRRLLEDFLGRHVAARRASGGDDLFSVLCRLTDDGGSGFSDEDVVNHMIFFLMAAHDTTTITTTSILRLLGQHPEWQERCREESRALGADPGYDEVTGLTSLALVMKEALRLVPPVPVIARRAVRDTEVMGVPIPAGRLTAVMVHLQHHMEELWPDPERFDPERFSDDRREDKVHRDAWEPFGGGVHKCLGMFFAGAEVAMIVHHLLLRFRWSVDPAYTPPLDYHSLPFPSDGQPVRLERLRS